jgi:hypothetical protein
VPKAGAVSGDSGHERALLLLLLQLVELVVLLMLLAAVPTVTAAVRACCCQSVLTRAAVHSTAVVAMPQMILSHRPCSFMCKGKVSV